MDMKILRWRKVCMGGAQGRPRE